MLAWTTSTMNAVRASESARATRAGGKARGTHRITRCAWGRMRDSRRPPRVDDASATTMDAPSEDDAIARGAVCGRALIFVSFRARAGARNGTARSNE